MTTATLAGTKVEINNEGFLVDPDQWTEEIAADIARREGMGELSERQWEVIHFMREQWRQHGQGPNVRLLSKTSGISIKELYQIFPKGPAKLAAKIAGIPKPVGCI